MKQLQRRRWKYSFALLVSLSVGSLLTASSVFAYQEVTVTDGGTITGKVTLKGNKPAPRGFNLVIIQRGKPFEFPVTRIEARDCRFLPYINVLRGVGKVEVVNMDPVMHDIQAYETSELGPRVLFNVPLPMNPHHPKTAGANAEYHKHIPGESKTQEISMSKGRRIFVMQCGFHAYMESFGYAVDNPYYALTDQSGHFTIPDVPPGTYKLVAWHPQERSLVEQEITVTAKGSVTVNFEVQAREGARAGMEVQENPHFGLGILGEKEIKPTLELQQP